MKPITNVKQRRKDIIKNFILVTILSTGVSLIANSLTKESGLLIALIPGLVCVLFVAIFYVKEYLGSSSYEVDIETVLSVDNEHKVIPIDRFRFSEDLYRAVLSVLSENKAYKSLWEDAFTHRVGEGEKGKNFVKEFLDYLFIHWISLQLNSYFVQFESDSTEIIGREQIPDVLIKNRVIELISKPFEEREKFQERMNQKDPIEGKIVYMDGEDGVVYDMLEIELPRKSKVYRNNNALVISNRNFDIRFESDYQGFGTVLPRYFEKFYLNRSFDTVHNYKVDLRMSIRLKPFFLFSVKDWKYLGWLDQIGDEFVKYFSFDKFVEHIGLEQAITDHILFLNGLKGKEEKKDSKHHDLRIVKVEDKEEQKS